MRELITTTNFADVIANIKKSDNEVLRSIEVSDILGAGTGLSLVAWQLEDNFFDKVLINAKEVFAKLHKEDGSSFYLRFDSIPAIKKLLCNVVADLASHNNLTYYELLDKYL